MIESLKIEGFRGIEKGSLNGLAPLTILVGPSGAGKSTILDCLLIGAGPYVGDSIGRAVARRASYPHTPKDLFSNQGIKSSIELNGSDINRTCVLEWPPVLDGGIDGLLKQRNYLPPYNQITCQVNDGSGVSQTHMIGFSQNNAYVTRYIGEVPPQNIPTRFLDVNSTLPLDQLYSDLVREGRQQELKTLLEDLIPDQKDVVLLTDSYSRPTIYIQKNGGRNVPIGLAGDGLVGFARLSLTLLTHSEKLLLLEEPEAHQHPACIQRTAKAIVEASRKDVQIVLSTHSLELIDYLLLKSEEEDLKRMALFKVVLKNGELLSSRLAGQEVMLERETIEEDLR